MPGKDEPALLMCLIGTLSKNGLDCIVIKAKVHYRVKSVDRKFLIYRKGDVLRLIPDTIGVQTYKEVMEIPRKLFGEQGFDPLNWVFGGRKGEILDMSIKDISDDIVREMLNKLPNDQLTAINEGE